MAGMTATDTTRRAELGHFLRSRRERIAPEDVGLPTGGRRRTPGLRREEVAQLAGVGVTWYTWLEQGREINASVQVLEAIARTLGMDSQERWHLFQLAGVALVPPPAGNALLDGVGQAILDQLDPFPAYVYSERYDILGYNRAYHHMAGGLDHREAAELNTLWLFFTDQYWQTLCHHRDRAAAHLVGSLRAAMAAHLDDPLWTGLVQRLSAASEEFDALWRRHDVVDFAMPAKDFRSPVGDLLLHATRLVVGSGDTKVMVYSPRDGATARRLEQLAALDDSVSQSGGRKTRRGMES